MIWVVIILAAQSVFYLFAGIMSRSKEDRNYFFTVNHVVGLGAILILLGLLILQKLDILLERLQ